MLLAVVGQDDVLQLDLDHDPLLVFEAGPEVVRLGDGVLVGLEDDLGPVGVHVQGPQDEDEAGEGREGGDRLQPVAEQVVEHHGRLRGF